MAFRHLKAAWRIKLDNSGLKLVLLALADMANDAGECWPSRGTLAEMCGLDVSVIKRHLRNLREMGLVTTRERFAENRQKSNIYTLPGEVWGAYMHPTPGAQVPPRITSIEPPQTKESKDDTFCEGGESVFSAIWKPDHRSKEQKLATITPPEDYPSEAEFDSLLENEELDEISTYRPGLYRELCRHKWHQWNAKLGKWIKIRDWRAYVSRLNALIARSKQP